MASKTDGWVGGKIGGRMARGMGRKVEGGRKMEGNGEGNGGGGKEPKG